jgi:hypothetical protein
MLACRFTNFLLASFNLFESASYSLSKIAVVFEYIGCSRYFSTSAKEEISERPICNSKSFEQGTEYDGANY